MSANSDARRKAKRQEKAEGHEMSDFHKMLREMEGMGVRVERTLMIQRSDVESMNVAPYLHTLLSILGDRETVVRRRQDVRPCFCGYDSDPRELFQVPEVRAFLSRLDQQFPYWFYFVEPACGFLETLLQCLCPCMEITPSLTQGKPLFSLNAGEVAIFATRHLKAMNDLIRLHGLDDENGTLSERLTRDVIATLQLDQLDALLSE